MVEAKEVDSDLPILESLRQLMADQKSDLLDNIESIPKDTANIEAFSNWFMESDRFKETYIEALRSLLTPRDDAEVKRVKERFRGQAFQYIASCFIARQKHPERVVLYPERTLNFYSRLHPQRAMD